jgi:hypothetical protein
LRHSTLIVQAKSKPLIGGLVMSKEQKGNKESKKAKGASEDIKKAKKEKKDPKRHDGPAK